MFMPQVTATSCHGSHLVLSNRDAQKCNYTVRLVSLKYTKVRWYRNILSRLTAGNTTKKRVQNATDVLATDSWRSIPTLCRTRILHSPATSTVFRWTLRCYRYYYWGDTGTLQFCFHRVLVCFVSIALDITTRSFIGELKKTKARQCLGLRVLLSKKEKKEKSLWFGHVVVDINMNWMHNGVGRGGCIELLVDNIAVWSARTSFGPDLVLPSS